MNLINRAKNMILTPKTEWEAVAAEKADVNQIIINYVVPFTIAGAVAAFIGYGLIGFGFGLFRFVGTSWGIYYALLLIIRYVAGMLITAFVADALAPSFGSEKNFGKSLQLVVYGSTPAFVAGLFSILPFLSAIIIGAGSIYSIYLWYLGLGPVKKTPEDKKIVYLIVTFAILLVVYFVIGAILRIILLPIFGLGFGLY